MTASSDPLRPTRRRMLALAAMASMAQPISGSSAETAWRPRRPIRVVVPLAPGGGTDVVTRIIFEAVGSRLGQPVVIENRAGANGVVGSELVARAAPDGQLFLAATGGHLMNRHTMPSLPFDPVADFAPVALLARYPLVLVASAQALFHDVAGLIARARANPGSLAFGAGEASTSYAGNLFARLAGLEIIEVPYRGSGPIVADLIAGHLPIAWASTGSVLPHLASGGLRALAVTSKTRAALLPDVPTIAEAGVTGYEFFGWYGLFGPARLPAEVARAIHASVAEAVGRPAVRERVMAVGSELDPLGPEDFARLVNEDAERWARAARDGLLPRA